MIIPIGNSGSIRRIPYITFLLIVLNIIIFYTTAPIVMRDNETINQAYSKYVKLVFNWYVDYKGESYMYVLENFDSLLSNLENETINEHSELFDRIIKAKIQFEKVKNEHIYMRLGVSRNNLSIITLITSMFMHGSFFHLIGNLWFLLLLGANIEDTYGRLWFFLFYIISGMIASLIFVFSQNNPAIPLIGASGAIAGVMGAFMIRHFTTKIKFLYFFFPIKPFWGTFKIMAGFVLPLWFIQQIINATEDNSSGIAFIAHIGGYFFGVIVSLLIGYFKIEEKYIKPRIDEATNILGLSIKQQNGIEAYYEEDYDRSVLLLEEEFLDKPNIEVFLPFINSLLIKNNFQKIAELANVFMEKYDFNNENILVFYNMLMDNDLCKYLKSITLFNFAKRLIYFGFNDEGIDLLKKIINNRTNIILGAKALKYLMDNELYYKGIDNDIDEYNKIQEVSIIMESIKKEQDNE